MQTSVGYLYTPANGAKVSKRQAIAFNPVSKPLKTSGDSVYFSSGWAPEIRAFSTKEQIKARQNYEATLRAEAQKAGSQKDTKDLRKETLKKKFW